MSKAEHILKILSEQTPPSPSPGSPSSSNGNSSLGNGSTSSDPTSMANGGDKSKKDNEKESEKPLHPHHLIGYGRYWCSCKKNTPPSLLCPNCKARKRKK